MKSIKSLFNNTAFAVIVFFCWMVAVVWAADTAINARGGAGVVADGDSVPIYDTSASAGATVSFTNIWTWIVSKLQLDSMTDVSGNGTQYYVCTDNGDGTFTFRKLTDNYLDMSTITLADFDYEPAWRMFYSNTDGDVTALAFNGDGTFLMSNGAAVAPSFESLAVGHLPTTGTWTAGSLNPTFGTVTADSFAKPRDTEGSDYGIYYEDDDEGDNYVGWGSPNSNDNDLIFLLPTSDPEAGEVMAFGVPSSVTFFDDAAKDASQGTWVTLPTAEDVAGMNAGSATDQYATADSMAGSYAGTKDTGWTIFDSDTSVTAGDGKQAYVIPASWNGMNLVNVVAAGCSEKGVTGALSIDIRRVRVGSRMGDDTSQFDLTDQTGDVCRITWDGTGTDPSIADSDASLRVGDVVDISGFTTSANDGHFTLTTVGSNYIQFTNASLSAENDQTSVTIIPIRHRDMLSTAVTVGDEYSASDETVDTSNDDFATGDSIYVDRTAIHSGTAQKGLSVTIEARLP